MKRNSAKVASCTYDLQERWLIDTIKERRAKRVLLQLPEGLKEHGLKLVGLIENRTSALAILSTDPCYGACDLALDEARQLYADLIVHYGHSEFQPKTEVPVVYIEARSDLDISEAVQKALPMIRNFRRVGLATTAQHTHQLTEARRILEESGKDVLVGKAGSRARHNGQVLGCDFSTAKVVAAKVDGFLFIGGGDFHPVGLALSTRKPVIIADPYLNKARRTDSLVRRILKQRWAAICKAKEATRIGVIIGLKPGQLNLKRALEIKREIEKRGKDAVILCSREITPSNISPLYKLDALVNTACPRIAIDDASGFRQVILTTDEAEVMLGRRSWEDYIGRDYHI